MSNPNTPSGGPPLRALAMVLIALAIVFAGIGAMALSSSDSGDTDAAPSSPPSTASVVATQSNSTPPVIPVTTPPAAATTTPPPTTPASTTVAPTTTASNGAVDKTIPVRVLNNSMVAGLAAKTAGELTASGWNVAETGNYGSGSIPKTTVYYGSSPKEQAAAVAIANELGVTAEPRFPGIADSASGVIVIVTGN